MQLVASIAGAQILVNTVGYVQGTLHLGNQQYGWVMAAFGVGATLASIGFGSFAQRLARTTFALMGAALITIALLPASAASLPLLMVFWLVAGAGQSWVNLPTQTLIADRIPKEIQGRVYGAHFAWSHLWWAFSYPLAGWLGSAFPRNSFLWGGLVGLGLLTLIQLTLSPRLRLLSMPDRLSSVEQQEQPKIWHDHSHMHGEHHQHEHPSETLPSKPHAHAHAHSLRHLHSP